MRTDSPSGLPDEVIELEVSSLNFSGKFSGIACGPKTGELVLCLHGFPQFADAYSGILEDLAAAGFRAVAVDQRGYSEGARPSPVSAYSTDKLSGDVNGFADALGANRFHLVGHDWGGMVAWKFAALFPDRLLSLTILSTPHPDALREAIESDADQKRRSSYILLFRAPFHLAELTMKSFNWRFLRKAYANRVDPKQIERNIRRFSKNGALTAALNWYRAMKSNTRTGPIKVKTLFLWGSRDQALGRTAAVNTAKYVDGPYHFEVLEKASHWLLDEKPHEVSRYILKHIQS